MCVYVYVGASVEPDLRDEAIASFACLAVKDSRVRREGVVWFSNGMDKVEGCAVSSIIIH